MRSERLRLAEKNVPFRPIRRLSDGLSSNDRGFFTVKVKEPFSTSRSVQKEYEKSRGHGRERDRRISHYK